MLFCVRSEMGQKVRFWDWPPPPPPPPSHDSCYARIFITHLSAGSNHQVTLQYQTWTSWPHSILISHITSFKTVCSNRFILYNNVSLSDIYKGLRLYVHNLLFSEGWWYLFINIYILYNIIIKVIQLQLVPSVQGDDNKWPPAQVARCPLLLSLCPSPASVSWPLALSPASISGSLSPFDSSILSQVLGKRAGIHPAVIKIKFCLFKVW